MEEFAVIELDTQEKKAEAEALLNELGYRDDEEWNGRHRLSPRCSLLRLYKEGGYTYLHQDVSCEDQITLDQLRAKLHPKKIGDVVVKIKSIKHGKEVMQAFRDLGVDNYGFAGYLVGYYYGLFDGVFAGYTNPKNSKVITLEQLKAMKKEEKPTYPCMMEVWDDGDTTKSEMEVIADYIDAEGTRWYVAVYDDRNGISCWHNARPIQPDPLKEVVEKLKSDSVTLTPNEAKLILDALEKSEN